MNVKLHKVSGKTTGERDTSKLPFLLFLSSIWASNLPPCGFGVRLQAKSDTNGIYYLHLKKIHNSGPKHFHTFTISIAFSLRLHIQGALIFLSRPNKTNTNEECHSLQSAVAAHTQHWRSEHISLNCIMIKTINKK